MAAKAMNVKLEESKIAELKDVATTFHITMTDAINEALDSYLTKMKKDPFYRLTANVEDASPDECEEILEAVSGMSDEDLEIASVKKFRV